MKVDYLLDSNCEACRADAPKVTEDELKELKPLVPSWEIIEVNRLNKLFALLLSLTMKNALILQIKSLI